MRSHGERLLVSPKGNDATLVEGQARRQAVVSVVTIVLATTALLRAFAPQLLGGRPLDWTAAVVMGTTTVTILAAVALWSAVYLRLIEDPLPPRRAPPRPPGPAN